MTTYPITGYTDSPSTTQARRARFDAWVEQRDICNQLVEDCAPRMNTFLEMVACACLNPVDEAYLIEQPTEAEAVQAEVANDDNWLTSSVDAQPDPIVKMFKRIANPYLLGSARLGKSTDKTVDVSKYFNGYKARATKTWAERHLNKGGG